MTLRGAYGAPTEFAYQFEHVVLVGTGVGATPFLALMKDIIWSNSIHDTLRNEAYKLAENPAQAEASVRKTEDDFKQLEREKILAKPPKKSLLRKMKFFNSYSYGIAWILIITIFLLLNYIEFESFAAELVDSNGVPVSTLNVSDSSSEVALAVLILWYIFAVIVIVGLLIDVFYRTTKEARDMPKRQYMEIILHTFLIIYTFVFLVYRAVIGPGPRGMQLAFRFFIFFSAIGWFLYINRIGGARLFKDTETIVKDTKTLRFIYVDRSFDSAEWMVKELQVLSRLAQEQKKSRVRVIIDVYFTRDQMLPTLPGWTDLGINTYQGRPNWDGVMADVVEDYNSFIDESSRLELADAAIEPLEGDEDKESSKSLTAGLFFCGSPVVANALRLANNRQTFGTRCQIVWHKEAFG